ncbi:MAG: cell division protein FtsL [Streptococcaceae bacterium]|jgi:cell division protein FtsL|nr:cell division protein FtsL [Streptococcaceae bacterium]
MVQRQEEFYQTDYDYYGNDYQEVEYYYEEMNAYAAFADEVKNYPQEEFDPQQMNNKVIYKAPRPFKTYWNKFSRLEKILGMTIVFVTVCFAISTIFVRSKIDGVLSDTSSVQTQNATIVNNINDLRQQVNELSRRERVEQVARDYGLSVQDNVQGATRGNE